MTTLEVSKAVTKIRRSASLLTEEFNRIPLKCISSDFLLISAAREYCLPC